MLSQEQGRVERQRGKGTGANSIVRNAATPGSEGFTGNRNHHSIQVNMGAMVEIIRDKL